MTRAEIKNYLSAVGVLEHGIIMLNQQKGYLSEKVELLGKEHGFEPEPKRLGIFMGLLIGIVYGIKYTVFSLIGALALGVWVCIMYVVEFLPAIAGLTNFPITTFLYAVLHYLSLPLRSVGAHFGIYAGTFVRAPIWKGAISEVPHVFINAIYLGIEIGLVVFLFFVIASILDTAFFPGTKKKYQERLKVHKQEESDRLSKEYIQIDKIKKEIALIEQKEQDAKRKLKAAYSANILPKEYRKLEIIAILHRYFQNGSVDTMKEAINKYDLESRLDRIETKLDRIMENQDHLLEQMYRTNQLAASLYSQNQRITSQNNAILYNTEKSAKYSRIAAINSEVALMFSIYNFYK